MARNEEVVNPRQVLAAELRRIRAGRTLRELTQCTFSSDSALSRYFTGQVVAPWQVVEALCRDGGDDPAVLRELWLQAYEARAGHQASQTAPPPEPSDAGTRPDPADRVDPPTPPSTPVDSPLASRLGPLATDKPGADAPAVSALPRDPGWTATLDSGWEPPVPQPTFRRRLITTVAAGVLLVSMVIGWTLGWYGHEGPPRSPEAAGSPSPSTPAVTVPVQSPAPPSAAPSSQPGSPAKPEPLNPGGQFTNSSWSASNLADQISGPQERGGAPPTVHSASNPVGDPPDQVTGPPKPDGPAPNSPPNSPPSSPPASPDVNGDGRADIVARFGTNLLVYPGTGRTGVDTFAPPYYTGYGWDAADSINAGDVNADGKVDILARFGGDLKVYPGTGGTGTNTFAMPDLVGRGWEPASAINIADVDSDGRADIVARSGTDLLVHPGTGKTGLNTFGEPYSTGHGWDAADSINAGDVNGDGKVDVLARFGGELKVYAGTGGSGTNTFAMPYLVGLGWDAASAIDIADVDRDGRADIVARLGTNLLVYPGTGKTGVNTFAPPYYTGYGWDAAGSISAV